jgi:hypothetical membrane protein
MKNVNNLVNYIFRFIPGGIFGLIIVFLTITFVTLSYMHFPGYNMAYNDISILGIGPGLSAPLFNNGLKIIGFTAIPFFIYLGKIIQQGSKNINIIKKAVRISIIGWISLSIIGFFPVLNFTFKIIHAFFALIFFVSSFVYLIIFSLAMLKDERFSTFHSYIGFIIAGLIAFYIAVRWSIVEWVVFFALGFWIIDISIYTLYKKFKL